VNIAEVHFIRAKSSLILSCFSERISYIYSLFSGKGAGEEQGRGQREREGEEPLELPLE